MLIRSSRLALLTTIACAVVAQAQVPVGGVHGSIRIQGKKPLGGAQVSIRNLATGEITEQTSTERGEFEFKGLPVGQFELSVSAIGMKPVNGVPVTVVAGQVSQSNLRIDADTASAIVSICLLYTSPSPRDRQKSRMPSSA